VKHPVLCILQYNTAGCPQPVKLDTLRCLKCARTLKLTENFRILLSHTKGKGLPVIYHEGTEREQKYNSIHF
jgi:hypothetical protein